jgi:hypothetical protein
MGNPLTEWVFSFSVIFINKNIIMKKIVRITESDLQRIVRRVINESDDFTQKNQNRPWLEKDLPFPDFKYEPKPVRDRWDPEGWDSTYSWYDPLSSNPYGRYMTNRGHWSFHNDPKYSGEWEDYEFDDFTELKRSEIPNDNFKPLRTRRDFDKLRNPETGKVHIRRNPHAYKKYYSGEYMNRQ